MTLMCALIPYLPGADRIEPVSHNAVKVVLNEPGKPEKVLIFAALHQSMISVNFSIIVA